MSSAIAIESHTTSPHASLHPSVSLIGGAGALACVLGSSGVICSGHCAPNITHPASNEKDNDEGEATFGYQAVAAVVLGIEDSDSFPKKRCVGQSVFPRPLKRSHPDEKEGRNQHRNRHAERC